MHGVRNVCPLWTTVKRDALVSQIALVPVSLGSLLLCQV